MNLWNMKEEEKLRLHGDVGERYLPKLRYLKEEEMYIIYLDAKNNILKEIRSGKSGISSVDVNIEEITRMAILSYSARVIIVHNHPSGDTSPSMNDIKFTEEIKRILSMLGIELIDHVIIGDGEYRSIINMV